MAGSIEATVPDDHLVRSSLPTLHQVTVSLALVLCQKDDLLMSHFVPIGFHYSEYYLAVALGKAPMLDICDLGSTDRRHFFHHSE
jgi:hypothetical protein